MGAILAHQLLVRQLNFKGPSGEPTHSGDDGDAHPAFSQSISDFVSIAAAVFPAPLMVDAFVSVLKHVHGVNPLTQWDVGVFKNRASAHGELLFAAGAVVSVAVLDGAGDVVAATRALDAVGPALGFEVSDRGLFVGELLEEGKGVEVVRVVAVDGGSFGGHVSS